MKPNKTICALAAALSIGGCGIFDSPEIEKPFKEDYQIQGAMVMKGICSSLYLEDNDRDGNVDSISKMGHAIFVAESYGGNMKVDEDTIIMTPEMQEAANKELHADRELSYQVHQALYDAQEKNKTK
ncbi:hypothetical protein HOA91_02645 [Candidatus Woesearchaeota archaeon]|jgi:hypothetical protein|nr:hypothetical protein [Candidatus Woesearchaeota archaeon]